MSDTIQIADGIRLNKLTDKRFKINLFSVMIFTDFDKDNRSDYAAVPYILSDSCAKYPSYALLNRRFAELYDAGLYYSVYPFADMRFTSMSCGALDDRYALNGEHLEHEACGLLLDCLLDPLKENGVFSEKTTKLMSGELADAIAADINDKRTYCANRGASFAFKGEPFGQDVQGTRELALAVTAQSAYSAYEDMLARGRIEIYAAGHSDFNGLEDIMSEAFGKIKRGKPTALKCVPTPLKPEPLYVTEHMDMQQAIMRMYFKAPEFADKYAGVVLSNILGGMTTSRFFMNIREKQSLCYYCGSLINTQKRFMIATAGVEPENIERTRDAVLKEFEDIRANGITEDELSRAKLESANLARSIYDSTNSVISWHSGQILDKEVITPEEYINRINAVTPERVRDACRKFALDTVYVLSPEDAAK